MLWARIFTGCRRLSADRIGKSDLPLCSIIAQRSKWQRQLREEVDCVVDMEDPGGRCSPVVVTVPGMRSGLPIQRVGSLLITTRSLVLPPKEELEEESCNDLRPLSFNSERLSAVHSSITGHLTFWFTAGGGET